MLAQARADGAPRLTRAEAARALGAEQERLEHALAGRARDAHDTRTGTGLREDQAAAVLSVLTDGKRVSVINAPAGSGKTHVLAEAGRRLGGGRARAGDRHHGVAVCPQHPGGRCPGVVQHRPVPRATCPASAAPAARSRSARAPCCRSTRPR